MEAVRDKPMTCIRCKKLMKSVNFYTRRDGTKQDTCSKCITAHVDPWDPETFKWILKDLDLPYVPSQWNSLRDKLYEASKDKFDPGKMFGRYVSKMKLVQWKKYCWADTETLIEEEGKRASEKMAEAKKLEEEIVRQYKEGTISKAQYDTYVSTETRRAVDIENYRPGDTVGADNNFREEDFLAESDMPDLAKNLTKEDTIAMAMKWGRYYKPEQWISMEKKYTEMMNSFDIQDSDTLSALVLICKLDLKMNEALDCGDMDTFAKLSRSYEAMRKSANFTAAQNKAKETDQIDCVGTLVRMCEKEGGFIPRYIPDDQLPQDKIDYTLKDMKEFMQRLVTDELSLGEQIERQIKMIQAQAEAEARDKEGAVELTDEELKEYYEQTAENDAEAAAHDAALEEAIDDGTS